MKSIFRNMLRSGMSKAAVLSMFMLFSVVSLRSQVPVDYEDFVPAERIHRIESGSWIPASKSTEDYHTLTSLSTGRIDGWVVICGEQDDEPSVRAGEGAVKDVKITGERTLTVSFGSVGGTGTLIVALKLQPYEGSKDSLFIEVIKYRKNGTPLPNPVAPRFKLGEKSFSIHTFIDSTGVNSTHTKSYIDGFGRVVQSSAVGASPTGGDLIDIVVYDNMGRESKTYLPFVADTAGALVYNPAFQEKFYADKYNDSRNAAYAYSKTDYDGSPLGVVLSTSPAGDGINSDSPDGGSPTVYGYRQNIVRDSVFHFELDSLNPGVVYKRGFYPKEVLWLKSSSLRVGSDSFDPVTEYYDCEGRKVMVQSSDASQRVYYVYDAFGRQCFTIPQVSAASMSEQRAYDMTDSTLSEYCYLKVYDRYGNVVREYTPGAAPSIYIYDKRNRLVLAQDPLQRQKNLWAFSKYDIFDRPVMVGVIAGGTENEYRAAVSNDTVAGERRIYAAAATYPYTDECFPILSLAEHEVYGINYYDNYDWTDIEWRNNADSVNYAVWGLLTRTASKVLGESKWMNKVVYYDSRYRKIRQYSDLYPDGVETVRMGYDFQSRLIGEYVRQRTSAGTEGYDRTYTYDREGRLLQIRQRVAGDTKNGEVELATYTYDDLGERLTRRFGNAQKGVRTTYKRNLTGTNIEEWGPVMLQRKYGNEVSYFGKKQPYTRLVEFTWDNQQGKHGYAYDYDASGRLLKGAYLQVKGSSPNLDEYDILERNSVHIDYDIPTDNITCITRSGSPMPMRYDGYRMTGVQIPGDSMSGTFLYDTAGNLTYDAVSRQKYEYNPVGRLQTLWNKNTGGSNMVAVCSYAWLEYTKPDNATDIKMLHREFPEYIDENGDIDVRYKVPDPNAAREYYYIPVKYPKLVDLEFVYSYSECLGLRYEYMGHTPVTSVELSYDSDYEIINENVWVYRRSIPSNVEALNKAYPEYFGSDGFIYDYYRLDRNNSECYFLPEFMNGVNISAITGSDYVEYPFEMTPPVDYHIRNPYKSYGDLGVRVSTNRYLRFNKLDPNDDLNGIYMIFRKYFDVSGDIFESYRIRDDYYYIPEEYYADLPSILSRYDNIEWSIVDTLSGVFSTPSAIDLSAPWQKHMEVVYNGQCEKLAVKFYDGTNVSSQIFYNGSFTYSKDGTAAMKLRDMMNPEGVVVKTTTGYAYRYFMRDYLNSVRHVSGIEQLTDYDPLGSVISSLNLDKNAYLYESKERYADFSAAYNGVYDFGARFYNPLYGRWFATDPAKQFVNPYMYCGNNPVQLVDPDGNEVIIIGDQNLMKMILKQLQSNVSDDLELDFGEDGSLTYVALQPQKKMSSNSKKLIEAIESKDITVNIYLRAVKVFNDSEMIGGAFMGNTYDATTGRVITTQYVDPEFMEHFDKAYEPGAGAMHEVLESFEGGKMAFKKGRSIPSSNIDERSYTKAHSRSSYIPEIRYDYLDNSGNITGDKVNASSVDVYYKNAVGTGSVDVYIVTMPYKYIEPN